VFHPYKLVKDLRTGIQTSNIQVVMDGDLEEFMKAYLMQEGSGAIVELLPDDFD
jgi:peptide chain release factor 2